MFADKVPHFKSVPDIYIKSNKEYFKLLDFNKSQ